MARLSEAEKQAFTTLAASADLRRDCCVLRENRRAFLQSLASPVDEYLEFLNALYEMFGHQIRPGRPIQGEHFIL